MADGTDAAELATPDLATTTSRLLKLPAELRNAIYELVAIESGPIQLFIGAQSRRVLPPALSRVCRRLRSEVLPIYWAMNIFQVTLCCETCLLQYRSQIEAALRECMARAGDRLFRVLLTPRHGLRVGRMVPGRFYTQSYRGLDGQKWKFEKTQERSEHGDGTGIFGYWFTKQ